MSPLRKMSTVANQKSTDLQANHGTSGDGGNRTHAIGPPSHRRQRIPFEDLPLDDQMRYLLAQFAVVSNGRTASYNSAGGGDQDADPLPPTGDASPPHLYYARAYGEPFHTCDPTCRHRVAENDNDRALLVADALKDLKALRRGHQIKVAVLDDPDQYRAELLRATEGWSPADVERSRWRMSARLVRKNRITAGRDPETGKKTMLEADDADLVARAREMKENGMSLRAIGLALKKDQKQIQRYLGKAA